MVGCSRMISHGELRVMTTSLGNNINGDMRRTRRIREIFLFA
jgi:hypothetical protein